MGFLQGSIVLVALCVMGQYVECKPKNPVDFVQVLFRHGARAPIGSFPTDKYGNESDWSVDWGHLTNVGKQQGFELGQWLRKRYYSVVPKPYSVNHAYMQSTDVDRSIMTGLSALAGLFRPRGDQIWNSEIDWQPIPVHTVPADLDYLLAGTKPCPEFDRVTAEILATDERVLKILNDIKPLVKFVEEKAGMKIRSFLELIFVIDTLRVQKITKNYLPDWAIDIYPELLNIYRLFFDLFTYTDQLSEIKAGFFLKEVFDRFANKSKNILSPDRDIWLYAAHDLNIHTVLNTLGLKQENLVPFAASLTFEMKIIQSVPIIQLFYRNDTQKYLDPLNIPNCGTSCPLSKLYKLYDYVLPKKSYDELCTVRTQKVNNVDDFVQINFSNNLF